MEIAIKQALKGEGLVHPNPMVGAVVVKGKTVIAKGYHKKFGSDHAEVDVLKKAGKKAKNATLYVTLEPCSTHGKTPPCVDTIIKAQIKKVVIAEKDSNPKNRNKGIIALKKAGIKVELGLFEQDVYFVNRAYHKYIKTGLPFVSVKMALSLDGKIATKTGDSKWISSPKSREWVQSLRQGMDAIMVGINTVIKDDARLTVRKAKKQPYRIVLDPEGALPLNARILNKDPDKIVLVTAKSNKISKMKKFEQKGVSVEYGASRNNKIVLKPLLKKMARLGMLHILCEGGGEIAASLLKEKLLDEVYFVIAPKIIAGKSAPTAFMGEGISLMKNAVKVENMIVNYIDKDLIVYGEIK